MERWYPKRIGNKELALQSEYLDGEHEVIQLHYGGGRRPSRPQ